MYGQNLFTMRPPPPTPSNHLLMPLSSQPSTITSSMVHPSLRQHNYGKDLKFDNGRDCYEQDPSHSTAGTSNSNSINDVSTVLTAAAASAYASAAEVVKGEVKAMITEAFQCQKKWLSDELNEIKNDIKSFKVLIVGQSAQKQCSCASNVAEVRPQKRSVTSPVLPDDSYPGHDNDNNTLLPKKTKKVYSSSLEDWEEEFFNRTFTLKGSSHKICEEESSDDEEVMANPVTRSQAHPKSKKKPASGTGRRQQKQKQQQEQATKEATAKALETRLKELQKELALLSKK